MERGKRFAQADRIVRFGFWINAALMVMKLLAGHFGRSEAVLADGFESASDFIAIGATMVALRIGRKPYDSDHPYGHGKAESIAAILVALLIFATGAGILAQAVHTVLSAEYQAPQLMAVAAAFATIFIKGWLYRFSLKTGSRLQSPALLAIAKDHRKDAITSIATVIGVSAAFFGLRIMDPLAAGITSLFIFHIGIETFRAAAQELMDALPSAELLQQITAMTEQVDGVEHVHEIRARRSGQFLIVDLKLDMDPEMTVKRSHAIACQVKKGIFSAFANVGDVMIHINPHDEEHEDLIRL
jgi:cation diffusion facilitator family transporter